VQLWNDRATRIEKLEKDVGRGTMLVGREVALAQRWREMQSLGRSRETAVTENEVLSAVNRWALAGTLGVTSLKPRWVDEDHCRKFEIQVSGSGSLGAISRFLYELESDPQPLKIEDVEIGARDNQGQVLTCDVRFTRLVLEGSKP
jgi:hypothetical protein